MKQTTSGLKERQNASPVLPTSGRAKADAGKPAKPARQSRGENTRDRRGRMSAPSGHSVFVIGMDGKPLAPTTPAKARKLLKGGQAEKCWSKFGTFGIKMLVETRKDISETSIGVDFGTKFEAHCTDALALACETGPLQRVEPGRFIVVDDSYRPVRRRLHDTQPAASGVRAPYSHGTVFGVQKGVLIGAANGKVGRLCGEWNDKYRYHDRHSKRQATGKIMWISRNFIVRKEDR